MKLFDSLFQRKRAGKEDIPAQYGAGQVNQIPEEIDKLEHLPMVESIERDTQNIIRGNRKRFMENHDYNIKLIKDLLPDENLVWETFRLGSISKTKVSLVYLKNKANPGIVQEIKERIKDIKSEIVLDSSYIERNIENSTYSPFPQLEISRRPDVAESALTQGRVAIIIDGASDVLLAPVTFFELMDTPDDAYFRWFFAGNFFRLARYIMFILAASLPGIYIALTSFNSELIPSVLLLNILACREETPFPIYFETFFMMGTAEAIRMMMFRMPNLIGVTAGLFSGIALVGAGLVANIIGESVVIIVTLAILCSFSIANNDLRNAIRIIQFFTMIMTSFFGLFGYAVAFFYIAIHLATLKSFGIPYMAPLAPLEGSGLGHTIYRENTKIMSQDETFQPKP